MKDQIPPCNKEILERLATKSSTKQFVFRKTKEVFGLLKEVLEQIANELNGNICNIDENVLVEYQDKGDYEAHIRFSGDVLIFHMHTNVFTFEPGHSILQLPYVKEDGLRGYFGMINMYNFLHDSFKYNRYNDSGHLLGRLFLNKEGHFFVEGKRQFNFLFNHLERDEVSKEALRKVVETAIIYALDFDLATPPFQLVREVTVAQIQDISNELRIKTSKELGYRVSARLKSD